MPVAKTKKTLVGGRGMPDLRASAVRHRRRGLG
jgi:hypothetical protein